MIGKTWDVAVVGGGLGGLGHCRAGRARRCTRSSRPGAGERAGWPRRYPGKAGLLLERGCARALPRRGGGAGPSRPRGCPGAGRQPRVGGVAVLDGQLYAMPAALGTLAHDRTDGVVRQAARGEGLRAARGHRHRKL